MNNSENLNTDPTVSDEISLRELLLKLCKWYNFLLSKWKIIALCSLLGGIVGFIYATTEKAIYTATTTFVLEDGDRGSGISQYASIASMAGIDLGGSGGSIFQGDNLLQLYKSRTMIQKTLLSEVVNHGKRQLLVDHYIDFNNLREKWNENPQLKNIQFKNNINPRFKYSRLHDSILGTIVHDINKNYLVVEKPEKKLSIIKVDVKSVDEFFSKTFNQKIVTNVNDFYVQTKTKKSLENVGILQQKADSVRAVMNSAIYTAAAVADATPNLNPTRQVQRIAPIQRSQFSAEANKIILSEVVKNLEMSKIALHKETPLIQVIDEPILPLERKNFGIVKGVLSGTIVLAFFCTLFFLVKGMIRGRI